MPSPTISTAAARRCRSRRAGTRWRSPRPASPRISRRCSRLPADVARHPRFDDAEIETRRDNLITSIRQEEDNPAAMAADAFAKALYGTHPYARKVRGTIAAIEAIRRQDLVRFHQKGYDPPAITVIVVGDVEEEAAIAAVSKLFGDWSPSAKATGDRPPVIVPDAAGDHRAQAGIGADDEQVAGRRGLRLRRHPPLESRLHRLLGDEQRPRAVCDWRTPRRQHSRAAGHGVLRVELARRDVRAGTVRDSRRRRRGQRREDDRIDRRRAQRRPRAGFYRSRRSTSRRAT